MGKGVFKYLWRMPENNSETPLFRQPCLKGTGSTQMCTILTNLLFCFYSLSEYHQFLSWWPSSALDRSFSLICAWDYVILPFTAGIVGPFLLSQKACHHLKDLTVGNIFKSYMSELSTISLWVHRSREYSRHLNINFPVHLLSDPNHDLPQGLVWSISHHLTT